MTEASDDQHGASGAPAQWYPDPTGRYQHRYWDGAAWTQNVADDGVASTDPLSGPYADSMEQTTGSEKQYPPEVQAVLPALLNAANPAGQLDAARELGELGDPAAVRPLIEVATTPGFEYEPVVRVAAVEALGAIGDPSAAPPVVGVVVAGDMILAKGGEATIGAMLARTADRAALAPLVAKASSANEEFDDDYPDWYDPNTSEFYMDTPREEEDEVSDACVAILSRAGEQGAECLLGVLGCPREAIPLALGAMEDPPVDRLMEAARESEGSVRAAALMALAVAAGKGVRRAEIEGMLKSALGDEDVRVRDVATRSLRWFSAADDEA